MPDLRKHVEAERRRRNLSVRRAALLGGCSNTAWGEWENGTRELGPVVQECISTAFGWPLNWPDLPTDGPVDATGQGTHDSERLAALEAANAALEDRLAAVADQVRRLEKLTAAKRPRAGRP